MMAQPQVNLQKSILNTPLTRRSILIVGMTLPAVSMLTGCGGGGGGGEVESDVVIPIAPFDPDTTPQIPDQGEKTEPEQGTEPIISPDAVKMNVGIYNFEYNSFEQLRARRKVSKGTAGSVLVTNKDGSPYMVDVYVKGKKTDKKEPLVEIRGSLIGLNYLSKNSEVLINEKSDHAETEESESDEAPASEDTAA